MGTAGKLNDDSLAFLWHLFSVISCAWSESLCKEKLEDSDSPSWEAFVKFRVTTCYCQLV